MKIYPILPACLFPDCLEELEEVFDDGEWRGEAGPGVVLLDEAVHLPLPNLRRVLVNLVEHGPAKRKYGYNHNDRAIFTTRKLIKSNLPLLSGSGHAISPILHR